MCYSQQMGPGRFQGLGLDASPHVPLRLRFCAVLLIICVIINLNNKVLQFI